LVADENYIRIAAHDVLFLLDYTAIKAIIKSARWVVLAHRQEVNWHFPPFCLETVNAFDEEPWAKPFPLKRSIDVEVMEVGAEMRLLIKVETCKAREIGVHLR